MRVLLGHSLSDRIVGYALSEKSTGYLQLVKTANNIFIGQMFGLNMVVVDSRSFSG